MRHIKLFALCTAALACGSLSLFGCSSDDSGLLDGGKDAAPIDSGVDVVTTDSTTQDAPADNTVQDVSTQDVTNDGSGDAMDDASDANLDGGSEADALPPEGTPCTPPNSIEQQGCGFCGQQYRACLTDSDGGYSWGSWGFCQGQVQNGCDPNSTYQDTACGNCGTRHQVCLSNCAFDLSQQCNEPTNACKPGSTDFELGLSCDGGGRERTCDNTCQFGNFGVCQSGPSLPTLQVPNTVNGIGSLVQTFDANHTLARVGSSYGTCPRTLSSTITQYNYIRVQNSTAQTATISLWHSQSNAYIDTVMAVYSGDVPPADNDATARGACLGYADDDCYDTSIASPASCVSSWAGLMGGDSHQITIAAGAAIVVYSSPYFSSGTGPFQINVKTLTLQ